MNKTKGYWRRDYVSQVLTKNKNIVNATIVQLDIQKITDVTGMSYEEAFKLYFDPSFKSDPNEVIRTHQLAQENDNNTNNNTQTMTVRTSIMTARTIRRAISRMTQQEPQQEEEEELRPQ